MEQVDDGFTLEVTNASFITDSEVELSVVALGNPNAWEVVQRSFDSNRLFKNGESLDFEMGHPNLETIKNPRDRLLRLFEIDETFVCFTLKQWIPTDDKNVFILRGHVAGPFGPTLKEALVNRDKPVYFGTRTVNVRNSYILGLDWIKTTKRKSQNVDSVVDSVMKKMAYTVKPPKSNWVIYDAVKDKFLGRIANPDTKDYPLPGESGTVWGWVDDIQKAKANWIIKPPLTILRYAHGLNFDNCFIRKVSVSEGVITLE